MLREPADQPGRW